MAINIQKKITSSKPFLFIKKILSKIILPGFDGIPLYDVLAFLIKGLKHVGLTTKASSLAYKFFLAIFPAFLFLLTLIPYIPIHNFQNELMIILQELLPDNVYRATEETLEDLIKNTHNSLLSFGFLFALYLTADGMNAMISAFDSINKDFDVKTSFIKSWLKSILLVFIIVTLLTLAVALIVGSGFAISYLKSQGVLNGSLTILGINTLKWIIILGLLFTAFSFLYWIGPDRKAEFDFVSPGSTFATIFCILISLGFTYYVDNFANYNKLYGSIGTVMVIMLLFYFNSLILLLGFELNATIKRLKNKRLADLNLSELKHLDEPLAP
jgi:membrane protein